MLVLNKKKRRISWPMFYFVIRAPDREDLDGQNYREGSGTSRTMDKGHDGYAGARDPTR